MADPFNTHQIYTAVPNAPEPTLAQSPTSANLNPVGDEYSAETSRTAYETDLIRKEIAYAIFDAVPAKYKIFRLLFDKPVEFVGNDVFVYMEKTFGRTALKASAITAGGATVAITVPTPTGNNVTENTIIVFPDNTKGVVISQTATLVTVGPLTGKGNLPAVAVNDYFSIQGPVIADGLNYLSHFSRMSKIERYNYVQLMERDKRWTRMEMQKFANLGITNYFDLDKKEPMELLLQDMFCAFWNGERGEAQIQIHGAATYTYGKTMGGIYPLMVAAGCANSSGVTAATLKEVFEALTFQTDYKSEGGVRYIFAQNALLYELGKGWKEPGIRYTPNDRIGDLNLYEYHIGDMRFVPIATELFKEISMFPATWKSRIFVLDLDTIHPVCMTGYQPIEVGQTSPKGVNGSVQDWTDWWIQGMLSLKFNNPLSSFYIDTTGIV